MSVIRIMVETAEGVFIATPMDDIGALSACCGHGSSRKQAVERCEKAVRRSGQIEEPIQFVQEVVS